MPNWTTKVNNVTTIDAAHINDLQKHISWECPEYYGAVGDGVTDDTAAIQAMIDGLPDNQPTLILCSKLYACDGISIPGDKSELHFMGLNRAIVGGGSSGFVGTTSSADLFSVSNGIYNLRFSDLLFTTAATAITTPASALVASISFDNVGFQAISDKAVYVADNAGSGIVSANFSNVNFYDCKYGFYSTYGGLINNLHFIHTTWENPDAGGYQVYVGGINGTLDCTNITIKDSVFNGTASTTSRPAYFGRCGNIVLDSVHFADYGLSVGTNDDLELVTLAGDGSGSGPAFVSIKNCDIATARGDIINISATTVGTLFLETNRLYATAAGHTAVTNADHLSRFLSKGNLYATTSRMTVAATGVTFEGDQDWDTSLPVGVPTDGSQSFTNLQVTSAAVGTYLRLYNSYNNAGNRNWLVALNQYGYGDLHIIHSNAQDGDPATAGTTRIYVDRLGNISLGGLVVIADPGQKVIGVPTGTAPTSSPADAFQVYSADQAAGNAAPHFRTENGSIIKLYKTVDADFGNTPNSGDVDTDDLLDKIRDALIAMGIIASS